MGTHEEDRLKPRQLLLFNDMLMLVKEKGEDKLSYKAHIDFVDQVSISSNGHLLLGQSDKLV
eukprot:SAG11_NODE_795_length_7131_cov_7.053185_6_plen_62_part_00